MSEDSRRCFPCSAGNHGTCTFVGCGCACSAYTVEFNVPRLPDGRMAVTQQEIRDIAKSAWAAGYRVGAAMARKQKP